MFRLILLAIVGLFFFLIGTDKNSAQETLQERGYSEIQTLGYGFLDCGRNELMKTEFTAVTPEGKTVRGVVCGGWLIEDRVRIYEAKPY